MTSPPIPVHDSVLILWEITDRGEWYPYHQRGCLFWFSTLDRCNDWMKDHPLEKPSLSPPADLAAQAKLLKLSRKEGYTGVACDPKGTGSAVIPIDELLAAIERRLAERG